jgi:hypothetical protein
MKEIEMTEQQCRETVVFIVCDFIDQLTRDDLTHVVGAWNREQRRLAAARKHGVRPVRSRVLRRAVKVLRALTEISDARFKSAKAAKVPAQLKPDRKFGLRAFGGAAQPATHFAGRGKT